MIDAVNWSFSRAMPNHESVSAFPLTLHEYDTLQIVQFDTDVPWHSAPTRANWELVIDGQKLEMYSVVVKVALASALDFPMSKTFYPRRFLLRQRRRISSGHWTRRR